MPRVARENARCALAALAGCAALAWLGLVGFAWSDYETEAKPAFDALLHGHLTQFLRLAPAYGGSLVERAPFAALAHLWGGGALAVYRMAALPCLLAAALLAVAIVARMRAERRPLPARAIALLVCVANPITLQALEAGHPEELLGACLCVAAVLCAIAERPLWAGVALGLAIANKDWALLAAGPVLLALPARRRLPCAGATVAAAAIVLLPLLLVRSGSFVAATRASASTQSSIFQPWQIWWFFGHHGPAVHGTFGQLKPDYRTGPAWSGTIAHPLILIAGLTSSGALWLRVRRLRGKRADAQTALLALALTMLLRCLLDTWDTEYYLLPFVFALLAWEVRGPVTRLPLLAASSSVLAWVSFHWLPEHGSPDAQAALFLAWTVPLAAFLARRLLTTSRAAQAPAVPAAATERASALRGPTAAAPQEMTVSALSRPLSVS
ncbi:MAG TPA: glycosyltransferase 87 family protein [Solirubrobacteraceae bacterium]|nr:glycosyltransferase 87 family protein [Solirubrobacteraceae bacterium]